MPSINAPGRPHSPATDSEHYDFDQTTDGDGEPEQPRLKIHDLSKEQKRYDFLHRKATPTVVMQNDIAQQIFDGESDRDMLPAIGFIYKDTLKALKISPREAIKSTSKLLRQNKLI